MDMVCGHVWSTMVDMLMLHVSVLIMKLCGIVGPPRYAEVSQANFVVDAEHICKFSGIALF